MRSANNKEADALGQETLVDWLQRFVRVPSEQSALHERDPRVLGFIRDCVAPLMSELGLEHRFDAMGNVLFDSGPGKSGRSLLFAAYAMTHPAASMTDPFSAGLIETPRGRAVRGRGVAEQKSALVAALGAVATAVRSGRLSGRLMFAVLTAGETGRHDAIACAMKEFAVMPDRAVVCIGTGNRIAVGNKGRVDFDITVRGKASHSSTPWDGINALNGAARVIRTIETYTVDTPPHPQLGPATLTATAIESGPKATHTIQDRCRITCDRRLLPGENPERVYEEISEAITLERPWTLDWERGPVMYPNEIPTDSPFFAELATAFKAAEGLRPEPLYCSFALDAGFFGRRGIPAVMLGPGDVEQFHSSEEYVPIADLAAMARVYHRLIETCLK